MMIWYKNLLCLGLLMGAAWVAAVASPGSGVKNEAYPWYRMPGEAYGIKVSPQGRFLAFTDPQGKNLQLMELETSKIWLVTDEDVGQNFLFSPDGNRLFFRALRLRQATGIESLLAAFDIPAAKVVELKRLPRMSGILTFDPRDHRLHLMHDDGILVRRLEFPGLRPARWQFIHDTDAGRWLATPKHMLWVTHAGFTMRKLADDESGIESFELSPDGTKAVWATKAGGLYWSEMGARPRRVGSGRDPSWHPTQSLIIYAATRQIAGKVVGSELKVYDVVKQEQKRLTSNHAVNERWPRWLPTGKSVVFAVAGSTDIHRIDL